MTSGSGKRKKGSGGLNDDDQALWNAFSKSVKPLSHPRHVGKNIEESKAQSDSRETKRGGEHIQPKRPVVGKQSKSTEQSHPPEAKVKSNLGQFDDRKARRLNSGRLKVESRLDLHGMRQAEAHAALRRFLHASVSKDYRTVLIITGKGFAKDDNSQDWDGGSYRERGVLRRMLPNWLEQPEMRGLVVSYTSAGPRHGGDGAYYVQLRNLRRRS